MQIADRAKTFVESVGEATIEGIEGLGELFLLLVESLIWMVRPPYRFGVFFQEFESFGIGSLFIVLLTGIFTGLVMSYQSNYAFSLFNAQTLVGATVAVSMVRELGPVLTALMVAGRTGSSMTTELGTMRVTEQIDAMAVMAINPVQYLVSPRVLAALLMTPVLNMLFNLFGVAASYALSVYALDIDPGIFMYKIQTFISPVDFLYSSIKAACFGLAIAIVGCYKGFYASGGAKGVGEATTSSVVTSSISVLFIDYVLTVLMW